MNVVLKLISAGSDKLNDEEWHYLLSLAQKGTSSNTKQVSFLVPIKLRYMVVVSQVIARVKTSKELENIREPGERDHTNKLHLHFGQ